MAEKSADQVRHAAYMFNDWEFAFTDREDGVLAVMTRKKPLFTDSNEE